MFLKKIYGAPLFLGVALVLAACNSNGSVIGGHKLVVVGNEHSIPMYSDEQSYLKVSRMKQEGGIEGMAGNVANGIQAKAVDDDTPVKVISTDENGAVVVITAGPLKGQSGFVPAQNVG